jgi:hypothetical protein
MLREKDELDWNSSVVCVRSNACRTGSSCASDAMLSSSDDYPYHWHFHRRYHYHCRRHRAVSILSYLKSNWIIDCWTHIDFNEQNSPEVFHCSFDFRAAHCIRCISKVFCPYHSMHIERLCSTNWIWSMQFHNHTEHLIHRLFSSGRTCVSWM